MTTRAGDLASVEQRGSGSAVSRLHGDTFADPGDVDFAVNVWPAPRPAAVDAAITRAVTAASYPDERPARAAIAARHGRPVEEVCLTNGACDAFWLIAHALRPQRVACIHPSFTEPEAALRAVGADVVRVMREPDNWTLDVEAVPDDAEVVVVGNPNNPTGSLSPADMIASLCRPGRLVVVDEAFMDFVPDEPESLAARPDVPVIVVRSFTKLFGLAGIRAGYVLAPAELVGLLEANRQPWSVNAAACAALEACSRQAATARSIADEVARERQDMILALRALGVRVWESTANFLLLELGDAPAVVAGLRRRGIVVRPADTFPGLGPHHVRVAVRRHEDNQLLLEALADLLSQVGGDGT